MEAGDTNVSGTRLMIGFVFPFYSFLVSSIFFCFTLEMITLNIYFKN